LLYESALSEHTTSQVSADGMPQSFILAQLLLSALPLLLFTSFVLSTLLLALLASVAFSLFWIGIAVLILVPTLCVTLSLGVGVWLWGVGCWVIWRWVWGIVVIGRGGVKREETGNLNGDVVVEDG
jgi:Promethin